MTNYIVYTEIIDADYLERWYYGTYNDEYEANEVALALGNNAKAGIFHCVCKACAAEALEIKNLP